MKKNNIYQTLSDIRDMECVSAALGFFDGLHLGHAEVIKAAVCNKHSLKSAVFTFSNEVGLPKTATTGHILSNELKLSLLKEIGADYIISLDFDEIKNYSPERFVKEVLGEKINAKNVACGGSFRFGAGGAADVERLKTLCAYEDISVTVVPQIEVFGKPISSTRIRKLIVNGDIAEANKLLGYDLMFEAEVIKGAMIGRTLGAPTINQLIPAGNVLPKFGVYKSYTELDGEIFTSLTNIGIKPTVSGGSADLTPLMETYILGFSGDLYGKTIRVSLASRIRDEKKFNNIYELKAQIEKDITSLEEK